MSAKPKWVSKLPHDTCEDAIAWASKHSSLQEAWDACERGDWMFWLIEKAEALTVPERRLIELVRCECVRPVLKYVEAGEDRPRIAVDEAEAWAKGEHDDFSRVTDARLAAREAACSAACSAAWSAACPAAWEAAWSAACSAAWTAAWTAAYVDGRHASLKTSSDIVRKHFPVAPELDPKETP